MNLNQCHYKGHQIPLLISLLDHSVFLMADFSAIRQDCAICAISDYVNKEFVYRGSCATLQKSNS